MNKTIFTSISIEEFEERLSTIIEAKVKNALSSSSKPANSRKDDYLTRQEVADMLRISLPTLNELTKRGALQGYRIGRRVLYKLDEVQAKLHEINYTKYKR